MFRTAIFVILASIVSAMASGYLTVFIIAVISEGVTAIPTALLVSWIGAIYAVFLAGPVALLLGSLLTALATRFFWARSAWTWSLAGAVTGILFAIMLFGGPRPYDASASAVYQWGITAAACAAVGIVSANMFRWTIKLLNKMFAPSPA